MSDETDLDLQRRALFLPLKTPEALHEWIKAMLGIDLPNVTIHSSSTSNPLDLIWDIYNHAVNDEAYDPKYYKILGYANRGGGKTASAAILEILLLFHGHRDIAHMAAIKAQSLIALKYVKGFLNRPVFSDFITQNKGDRIEITKFYHKTQNHFITPLQWAELGPTEKTAYEEITNFLQVIVATMQSANGLHCSYVVCVDGETEIEVRNKETGLPCYVEAQFLYENIDKYQALTQQVSKSDPDVLVNTPRTYQNITGRSRTWGDIVRLEFDRGNFLRCTPTHPLWTINRGYVQAQDLTPDDICWNTDLGYQKLSFAELEGEGWVYDFTVENNHNFLANKMLVSNCDELDVIPNRSAYEELKGVPTETRDGKVAITFLTSTRKFSHGIVQKEIDDASKTGLIIKHWNVIDAARACSPTRHLPHLPKLKIYYDTDTLKCLSEQAFAEASPAEQARYTEGEGFNGCLTQCSLFASCLGKLATHQRDGAAISRSIDSIENDFLGAELDMIKAQFLCENPSKEGLIYPRLDPKIHLQTAEWMYEKIFRKPAPKHFSKQELVARLKADSEIRFFGGMDHGHTDPWAVVIGAKFGHFLFIIEAFQVSNLEIGQKLTVANKTVRHYDATFWPDTNRPDDNKTFALHGYKMRQWSKKGGSVDDGINAVRLKLMPALGQEPEIYFLKDDPGVELLFKHLKQYHWKLDAQQEVVEVPDEENDHLPDAFRYLVMNLFPIKAGERATSQDIIVGSEAVSVKDKEYSEMTPQELQAALYWETMAAKVGVDMGIDSRPRNKKGKRLKFQF